MTLTIIQQPEPIHGQSIGFLRTHSYHFAQQSSSHGAVAQLDQFDVGRRKGRVQQNASLEHLRRLDGAIELAIQLTQIVVGIHVFGRVSNGPLEVRFGLAGGAHQGAQIIVGARIAGPQSVCRKPKPSGLLKLNRYKCVLYIYICNWLPTAVLPGSALWLSMVVPSREGNCQSCSAFWRYAAAL